MQDMQETQASSWVGKIPLVGKASYSSILAWKIPWIEEPGGPQSIGSQRVRHKWVTQHAHGSRGCPLLGPAADFTSLLTIFSIYLTLQPWETMVSAFTCNCISCLPRVSPCSPPLRKHCLPSELLVITLSANSALTTLLSVSDFHFTVREKILYFVWLPPVLLYLYADNCDSWLNFSEYTALSQNVRYLRTRNAFFSPSILNTFHSPCLVLVTRAANVHWTNK